MVAFESEFRAAGGRGNGEMEDYLCGHSSDKALRKNDELRAVKAGHTERGKTLGEGAVEGIADIDDHPLDPARAAEHGIAGVGASKQVQEELIGMGQAGQEWFAHGSGGESNAFQESVGNPVGACARIEGGVAIQVDADRAGGPRKGIVVMV